MHDGDGMGVRGAAPAGCGAEPREENFDDFSLQKINFLDKRDDARLKHCVELSGGQPLRCAQRPTMTTSTHVTDLSSLVLA